MSCFPQAFSHTCQRACATKSRLVPCSHARHRCTLGFVCPNLAHRFFQLNRVRLIGVRWAVLPRASVSHVSVSIPQLSHVSQRVVIVDAAPNGLSPGSVALLLPVGMPSPPAVQCATSRKQSSQSQWTEVFPNLVRSTFRKVSRSSIMRTLSSVLLLRLFLRKPRNPAGCF